MGYLQLSFYTTMSLLRIFHCLHSNEYWIALQVFPKTFTRFDNSIIILDELNNNLQVSMNHSHYLYVIAKSKQFSDVARN